MATYTLISSNTLSTTATSITFSSIPSTYTDLVIRWSARYNNANLDSTMQFNGDTGANYGRTELTSTGGTASSSVSSSATNLLQSGTTVRSAGTANAFSNTEVYISNYLSSVKKTSGSYQVAEDNSSAAYYAQITIDANLWQGTSAITSIVIDGYGSSFISGSSFYLYGISNA